ncbi:hypothetical protein GCM10028810_49510 [Spirosoma litoris]
MPGQQFSNALSNTQIFQKMLAEFFFGFDVHLWLVFERLGVPTVRHSDSSAFWYKGTAISTKNVAEVVQLYLN